MARAALRRRAIDGPFDVMQQKSKVTSVYCLAARRATYGPYRPLLDGPFTCRRAKIGPSQMRRPEHRSNTYWSLVFCTSFMLMTYRHMSIVAQLVRWFKLGYCALPLIPFLDGCLISSASESNQNPVHLA